MAYLITYLCIAQAAVVVTVFGCVLVVFFLEPDPFPGVWSVAKEVAVGDLKCVSIFLFSLLLCQWLGLAME